MRTLSPFKAVLHALNSVSTYPGAAIRFGMFWIPLLFVIGLVEWALFPQAPDAPPSGAALFMQMASAALSLIGFGSMAVSWHRFILRDEVGSPTRVDPIVWRYVGNSLLIMVMILAPIVVMAAVMAILPPIFSVLFLPVAVVAGASAVRLSIKLPAVALGRTDFGFRDAWAASTGNFWQIVGVFFLNAAVVFSAGAVFMLVLWLVERILPAAVPVVALLIAAAFQLAYVMFNASIFTSLYGFFIEKRDF